MCIFDFNSYRSVEGFNQRVRFMIMHYSANDFIGSVRALTGPSASTHYLILDPADKTYIEAGFNDICVFDLLTKKNEYGMPE